MKTLDDQMADIEKLDELRRLAKRLKQDAIDVLSAAPYLPEHWCKISAFRDRTPQQRDGWEPPCDDVESAQVLRALKPGKGKNEATLKQSRADLVRYFDSEEYAKADWDKAPDPAGTTDNIPILRCAYVLQALAEVPGHALSRTALVCFFRIVRELNEIVHPTWVAGAARGDDESLATAFVTGECARALLALKAALLETATAAELLGTVSARETAIAGFGLWGTQEKKLQNRSLKTSLAALPHLIIETARNSGDLVPEALLGNIEAEINKLIDPKEVEEWKKAALVARISAAGDRTLTTICSAFANAAVDVAETSTRRLIEKLKSITTTTSGAPVPDFEERGKAISKTLKSAAEIVSDVLLPIEQFAESAIDRQISATSPHLAVTVDGAELVFAATLLGLITDWKRPKVRAAYEVLYPLLSANGRLLSIRPFDLNTKGYRLHVATLEVTRRLADLVANLDVEPSPDFVTRLMLPFEYTRAPGEATTSGWTTDPPKREPKSLWWLTSIAANALESTIHMLDRTINRRILPEFQVRQPETISYQLDRLFYPDYGLAKWAGEDSLAIALQGLRAHACNGPPEKDPKFSLILYGPPGTGKTTLVEALARSAGVPLVEITPSDILVGGAEGMERRARQVFRALSKLTHVVILFDEFDSILLDRDARGGKPPTSVIEFLTPGMLPKLKALHDAGETGRVSYVLATNYLHHIDKAASREGRFDVKCGVYPPDAISRLGRLRDQLRPFLKRKEFDKRKAEIRKRITEAPAAADKHALERKFRELGPEYVDMRLLEAVRSTRGGPMSKLGKPASFTAPTDEKDAEKKLFGHILYGNAWRPVDPEADYEGGRKKYDKKKEADAAAATAAAGPGIPAGVTAAPAADLPAPEDMEDKYWNDWKIIEDADDEFETLMKSRPTLEKAVEKTETYFAKP